MYTRLYGVFTAAMHFHIVIFTDCYSLLCFKGDAVLNRATQDVQSHFPDLATFKAVSVFIATWQNVTYAGGDATTPVCDQLLTASEHSLSNASPFANLMPYYMAQHVSAHVGDI